MITAISLAAGLAQQDQRVLLEHYPRVQRDETVTATILDRKPLQIHQTKLRRLDIAPSHILLSNTDIELTTAIDHREARLKAALDEITDRYDQIVIDCPPTLSWLTINALTAADQVIVVVSPGYFELDSIVQLSKTIREVRKVFNPALTLRGFLFTMNDPTVAARTSLKVLRQTYTDQVFGTVIPRNTDIRDAHLRKQDIFSYNPKAKAAQAYQRLIREVFVS
jgi:chromosome partitioning protein